MMNILPEEECTPHYSRAPPSSSEMASPSYSLTKRNADPFCQVAGSWMGKRKGYVEGLMQSPLK